MSVTSGRAASAAASSAAMASAVVREPAEEDGWVFGLAESEVEAVAGAAATDCFVTAGDGATDDVAEPPSASLMMAGIGARDSS